VKPPSPVLCHPRRPTISIHINPHRFILIEYRGEAKPPFPILCRPRGPTMSHEAANISKKNINFFKISTFGSPYVQKDQLRDKIIDGGFSIIAPNLLYDS
jgi:hypothetical protein